MDMKKENEKEIGKNLSSGAEKVEQIAAIPNATDVTSGYVGTAFEQNPTLTNPALLGVGIPVETENKTDEEKVLLERASKQELQAENERVAAEKRVRSALDRKEKKEKAKKAKEEKRLANERRKSRSENGSGGGNSKEPKRRNPEIGGWIAAVVALSVTTLALGAVVTVGAIDMKETKQGITTAYRGNLYELTGLIENVDGDLDRIRVSASPAQQQRILTDLLVQTRLAESVLEKLPVNAESDGNVTAFINRTAAVSEMLLAKLRAGGRLDQKDGELLEKLYQTNHKVRGIMDDLIGEIEDEDLMEYLKGAGEDKFTEAIRNVENATIEENRNPTYSAPPEVRAGAMPKDDKREKISSSRAEELCRGYFSDYNIDKIEFDGETTSRAFEAYNFVLTDMNGIEIFAQLAESDGRLISFDYYEYCEQQNFDLENAKMIAENFLVKLGMENMTAVKVAQTGATASFAFAYELDGSVYYPDLINIKVCEQKGVVVGYNASAYLQNHKPRTPLTPKLSLAQASAKLHEKLSLDGSRVALIAVKGKERVAYEFICSYGEDVYFVYIDADTGEEISIMNVKNIMR